MIRWAPYAFLRFVFFLLIGILCYIHAHQFINSIYVYALFGALTGLYLMLFIWHRRTRLYSLRSALGLTGFLITVCFGFLLTYQHTASNSSFHLSHQSEIKAYTAVVSGWVQERGRYYKAELEVGSIYDGTKWQKANGRLLAYIEKEGLEERARYGDQFIVYGKPVAVKGPSNPEEFDYRQFLSYQQIFHQHYIQAKQIQLIGHQAPGVVMDQAIKLRSYSLAALNKYLGNSQEYAIAAALVLGVKDSLDNELKNAYSAAGAMHVLAVSGLHVGIIYMFLSFVLGSIQKHRQGKFLFALLILLILWLYAFVTGLSASVLRAVTMFSLITVAQTWRRSTNIYNTLAVSAFALLCFDPYLVMSVGFQLSYAAMLGIVYLYQPINSWMTFNNLLLRRVWQLTAVSIAAQVATLPISLYYFHKIPTFFWLSNLFVMPAAYIVLIGGLLIIASSFIAPLAALLGAGVLWCLKLMNGAIFWIEKLPYAQLSGLVLHPVQLFLLYSLLITILLFAHYRKFRYLQYAALNCLLISGISMWRLFEQEQQKSVLIYNIPGHSATGFHQGRHIYFLSDSLLLQNKPKLDFHVQNDWWQKGVTKTDLLDADTNDLLAINIKKSAGFTAAVWHHTTFLFIDQPMVDLPADFKVEADYIVVQRNAVTKPELLFNHFSCKLLIIDSSNKAYLAEKISRAALQRGYPCQNVQVQGAFVLKL